MGTLFVISGPSGVGKGTLVNLLMQDDKSLVLSVSCTTRRPRVGEVNGKSYSRNYLTHDQLTRGANIQFQMSPVPNKQRGTTEKDVPYSLSFE